jgi:hypothetical protein
MVLNVKQCMKVINLFHTMHEPVTVAARSETRTVFACSNTGVVVSNTTQGMDVCLCLFCVCVE